MTAGNPRMVDSPRSCPSRTARRPHSSAACQVELPEAICCGNASIFDVDSGCAFKCFRRPRMCGTNTGNPHSSDCYRHSSSARSRLGSRRSPRDGRTPGSTALLHTEVGQRRRRLIATCVRPAPGHRRPGYDHPPRDANPRADFPGGMPGVGEVVSGRWSTIRRLVSPR